VTRRVRVRVSWSPGRAAAAGAGLGWLLVATVAVWVDACPWARSESEPPARPSAAPAYHYSDGGN
jgi:hypothetical protein